MHCRSGGASIAGQPGSPSVQPCYSPGDEVIAPAAAVFAFLPYRGGADNARHDDREIANASPPFELAMRTAVLPAPEQGAKRASAGLAAGRPAIGNARCGQAGRSRTLRPGPFWWRGRGFSDPVRGHRPAGLHGSGRSPERPERSLTGAPKPPCPLRICRAIHGSLCPSGMARD